MNPQRRWALRHAALVAVIEGAAPETVDNELCFALEGAACDGQADLFTPHTEPASGGVEALDALPRGVVEFDPDSLAWLLPTATGEVARLLTHRHGAAGLLLMSGHVERVALWRGLKYLARQGVHRDTADLVAMRLLAAGEAECVQEVTARLVELLARPDGWKAARRLVSRPVDDWPCAVVAELEATTAA